VNVAAVDPVHERVEVAEVTVLVSETLVGLRAHVRPVDGETVSDSVTVPVNPLVAATVTVEVPGDPTATLTVVGLAVTVKLGAAVMVYATLAEWESVALVPVTVTVNEPVAEPVHDRVEVADVVVVERATLVGLRAQVRPVEGDTVADRETVPVKPFTAAIVIVDVPGEPTTAETVEGLALTVKSGAAVTVKVTVAEWDRDPLTPVTLTVKVPVVEPVHDRLEAAEVVVVVSATLVGVRAHVKPVEGDTVSESATVPVKPFVAETVIVEVPGDPTAALTLVGLAVTVKSGAGLMV
jgi:hypothetical protein